MKYYDLKNPNDATPVVDDGSVPFTGDQSMGDNRLTNVALPASPSDAVSYNFGFTAPYVDLVVGDDSVVRVDNAPNSGMMCVLLVAQNTNDDQRSGILGYQTNDNVFTMTLSTNFDPSPPTASDTPPGGTSTTDGFIAVQMAATVGGRFWLVNRLGTSYNFRIMFLAATGQWSGTQPTATNL